MKDNFLKYKSLDFAVRIINLYKFLGDKKDFVISKQILSSGTSAGASIREAEFAESKPDFIHKLSISQKEINETLYWLELLLRGDFINSSQFESINNDAVEIIKLFTKSIKTAKANISL